MKNVKELSLGEVGSYNGGIKRIDGVIIVDSISLFPQFLKVFLDRKPQNNII